MTDTPRQLSRVAGVPRLRLPIWKAAAAQFFQGKKDPSRDEQRNNGKKTKVALLRELVATDPKVKSWLIQFAADLRARGAREIAAEQGFVMPETLGFVPLFPGDRPDLTVLARTVICMEKPNAEELLQKIATLYPDGDPPEVLERQLKELEALQAPKPAAVEGCNTCGFSNGPATRTIEIGGKAAHFCDKHDGKRPFQFQPVADPGPAAYINSGFGKDQNGEAFDPDRPQAGDTPYIAGLKALRRAQQDAAALVRPARATYGPTPEGAIVVSVMSSPDEK
jgi:hypothetical protein